MLKVEEITLIPEEQALIRGLDDVLADPSSGLYKDLPHHNYGHVRDEVLPEALRLDSLDPDNSTSQGRLELAAASLTHDLLVHLPLDPDEGFDTKEARTIAKAKSLLPSFGFTGQSLDNVLGSIGTTAPGTVCKTPNEIKLRRADISNVGSEQLARFLAVTVKIFHEEKIISAQAGVPASNWETFIGRQATILKQLLEPDLSVGTEPKVHGLGRFNRLAQANVAWLGRGAVRDPDQFVKAYGPHLEPPVPNFANIVTASLVAA